MVCTGSYTLTQADLDAGQVANTATGDSDQTSPGENHGDRCRCRRRRAHADQVRHGRHVSDLPGHRADAGDRIVYTLTATNAGNVTLTGVTIVDPKLGTLSCNPAQPATLAPGRAARLHRQLHADAGRPQRRRREQHGNRRTAIRRRRRDADGDGDVAAGAVAGAGKDGHARH